MAFINTQIHVDKHLTNIITNYEQQSASFVANEIFPVVPVMNKSDMIPVTTYDSWRVIDDERSPGTEAARFVMEVGSDSYSCTNHALKTQVTLEELKNADPIFLKMLTEGRVKLTANTLLLNKEKRVALTVTNTSNVASVWAPSSAWTDYTNSTPLAEMEEVIDNIKDNYGFLLNKIVFSYQAWRNFSRNKEVIDKANMTGVTGGGRNATQEQVAQMLNVEKVMVAMAQENTTQMGQEKSLQAIWGDKVFLYYAPNMPSMDVPSYGYEFKWQKNGLPNWNVERHPYNSNIKAQQIEIGYYSVHKVTAPKLGAIISHTTSSN